jgi:hypothetical protein
MAYPRTGPGIIGLLSSYEFYCAIKKHNELKWILNYDEESNEMKEFVNLTNRIRKLYTDNISMDKAVELYPNYEFNTAFPWSYCTEIVCIILDQLKYKHWNQYYFSQMDDERLIQMVEWAYKQYRMSDLENDISQDFN